MLKRTFDVVASLALLVVIVPVLVTVALVVRLDSAGPIFFRQVRVGRDGRPFVIFKFRSMVDGASEIGGHSTAVGDPRITHAGRFIRKTSLDELPQLLNVLAGDMSIVGPRPDVPAQRSNYSDEEWNVRHKVRPGITGLSQATLRSDATIQQRKDLDLAYVRNASLSLDFKILMLTVKQILLKGSH